VKHTVLAAPVAPHVYLSHNQEPWGSLSIVMRSAGTPPPLSAVRDSVRALDSRIPAPVRAMADVVHGSVSQPRLYATILGLFAALALALSTVGIFAVVSYSASRRTRELGVRLALGARRMEVIELVLAQGLRPVAAGILAGVAGAAALTRFLDALLFGVEPGDPLTFAAVVALVILTAAAACWLPAWRASRLDPVAALRRAD
jgi:ABC-type antimicrobial peptide transport system permease subunit